MKGLLALIAGCMMGAPALAQTASAPLPAPAASSYDQAVADRLAGRLDKAIEELRALSKTAPMDADVWLNLGLALTAKGDFDAAEAALKQGLEISPHYDDLNVAYARLAFFRQHPAEARQRLEPALQGASTPDAQELLKQITSAEREAMGLPWRVDATATYSSLSKGLEPWREGDVAFGRRIDAVSSLSLGIEESNRFGVSNVYLHGEYSRRFGDWSGFFGYGGSPDAVYRARYFFQGGVGAPAVTVGGGWTLAGELDTAYGVYPADSVTSVTPIMTLARGDDLSLSARYIWTSDRDGAAVGGYAVQAIAPLASFLRLSLGYADAPDISTGVILKTRNYSAGIALDVPGDTTLKLSGAHETGAVYTRDDYVLGVTHRF